MALFLFDVLNTTDRRWNDEAIECEGRDQSEAHGLHLLAIAQAHHDGGMIPVTVIVLNSSYAVIFTAVAKPDNIGLTLNWLL